MTTNKPLILGWYLGPKKKKRAKTSKPASKPTKTYGEGPLFATTV